MASLLQLVRQSILINTAKAFRPTDDNLERERCEAWFSLRRSFPNLCTSQLERVIREGVERKLHRLERGFSVLCASNDTTRLAAAVSQ